MTFDIIQTNYLTNQKRFLPYYRLILGIAFIIYMLKISDIHLSFVNKTVEIISEIIIGISILLVILDSSLFSRIGHITINNEKILISKNDIHSEFALSTISNIKIKKTDGKQYFLKVEPLFKEIIELSQEDLAQLKNFLDDHQIDYQHTSIMNWLKNLSFIKNNRQTF